MLQLAASLIWLLLAAGATGLLVGWLAYDESRFSPRPWHLWPLGLGLVLFIALQLGVVGGIGAFWIESGLQLSGAYLAGALAGSGLGAIGLRLRRRRQRAVTPPEPAPPPEPASAPEPVPPPEPAPSPMLLPPPEAPVAEPAPSQAELEPADAAPKPAATPRKPTRQPRKRKPPAPATEG